ncbi:hypothetical protein PHSY_006771 [Pseudozyma hubeiensis SY62]|uniref:D-lactate dehydratase n=1 Tax=Pseudozyma hubeiensis (strain SY62) TaxID=1305764 RepID=R9PD41_PSEHS|nr:hypothetical protein PHSY_006771 [Pseudozyma hubeiensis SY62]GAC99172.1 hypothetical protein PHSY_006771 [Pseudozyma hubeiensis SY62]
MPSALILIAEGTEESEFTIVYDLLVRASVSTTSALVNSSSSSCNYVTCSRGVRIVPDLTLTDLTGGKSFDYDCIVIPGGAGGAKAIAEKESVTDLIAAMYGKGKIVAAICAGTLAIKAAGVGKDAAVTSHPSVKAELDKEYTYKEERVVVSDKLVTSRAPGTAFEFALTLVEMLVGKDKRKEVEGGLLLPTGSMGVEESSPDQVN